MRSYFWSETGSNVGVGGFNRCIDRPDQLSQQHDAITRLPSSSKDKILWPNCAQNSVN